MANWARAPFVQFLALGAVLFGLARILDERPETGVPRAAPRRITITTSDAARLAQGWARRTGATADEATRAALVESAIEEEMLAREARRLSLDRNDPAVRARLLDQMRFLESGATRERDASETDEALVAEARSLGLDRSDAAVRRILAGRMRSVLAPPSAADDGDTASRRAWFLAHAALFRQPARVSLQQLPLPQPAADPAAAQTDPSLLEQLRGDTLSFEQARRQARPLPLPAELSATSETRLATIFGADFARVAMQLEPGSWQGPIRSAHGSHLVLVIDRFPATPATFEEVEPQVRLALRAENRAARLARAIGELRERYEIHAPGRAILSPPPRLAP